MLLNFLKFTMRKMLRNKAFTAINVIGLSVSIAASLVLLQYAYNQYSYDGFHKNADQIYRLQSETLMDETIVDERILIDYKFSDLLNTRIPQIAELVRIDDINYMNNTLIYSSEKGTISAYENETYIVSENYFDVFDFTFLYGNASRFNEPDKIILTASTAKKFFGDKNPIGKNVKLNGNIGSYQYEVIGVLHDLPINTHFKFNTLLSFGSEKNYNGQGLVRMMNVYLKVENDSDMHQLGEQINQLSDANLSEQFLAAGKHLAFKFHKLEDIHLHHSKFSSFKQGVSVENINLLILIAIIILIIAWFNYVNLSSVQTLERSKEIGIRKVLGSEKRHILLQFVLESFLISFVAGFLAFTIIQIISPFISYFIGLTMDFPTDLMFWLMFITMLIVGSLLTTIYPTLILSGYDPLSILKKKIILKKKGFSLSNVLVIFQFAVTAILIGSTITVYKQIQYMVSADIGINIQNIVVLKSPPSDVTGKGANFFEAAGIFKNELMNNPIISTVATSSSVPGRPNNWGSKMKRSNESDEHKISIDLIAVGDDYEKAYELELLAGRLMQPGDDPWVKGDIVVNEELIKQIGFSNANEAIGEKVKIGFINRDLIIQGVVRNHNQVSLHVAFSPMVYLVSVWSSYFTVKLNINEQLTKEEQLAQIDLGIKTIEKEWNQSFPDANLDYFFLDKAFDEQYNNDREFGNIFGLFAGLAILIASLGLFGLSSLSIAQRTKEIGVRKVLGASQDQLIRLLSKEYILLILIANALSIPVAWIFLSDWLSNYHFSISLGWWLAFMPLGIILCITFITISSRVIKASVSNPIESLRYE